MLTVSCPQCSCKMKAQEDFAGKKAKCGKCSHVFVVQGYKLIDAGFKPLDPPPPSPPSPLPSPVTRTPTKVVTRVVAWVACIVVTIIMLGVVPGSLLFPLALAALIAAAIFYRRKQSASRPESAVQSAGRDRSAIIALTLIGGGLVLVSLCFFSGAARQNAGNGTPPGVFGWFSIWTIDVLESPVTWVIFLLSSAVGYLKIIAKRTAAAPEGLAPERKPCPSCGESIAIAAIKCRFCGEQLRSVT